MRVGFGDFTLDATTRELTRRGEPVHLSPKAFQLLTLLVRARPSVVDRGVLRQQLWPETHVVDAALANLVAEIRSAFGEKSTAASIIRTVHGVGYAFAMPAEDIIVPPDGERTAPLGWIVWDGRALPVESRHPTLGRDPSCDIWIDAPGVSRRHARLSVSADDGADAASIEDLGSTNGTRVAGRRVRRQATVRDGDTITLGDVVLTFRQRRSIDIPTKRVRRR